MNTDYVDEFENYDRKLIKLAEFNLQMQQNSD